MKEIKDEGFAREIGLWGLISNSINITIGAGIFILPAIAGERLGVNSVWAYLLCGIIMMLIMLCFAEVGSRITITGGPYSYIERAFGKFAGYLTSNIFIFGGAIMANAAVANGLADTAAYFIPVFDIKIFRVLFFALVFGGLAFINVRGIKYAIRIVEFNTIAKLTPLILIALTGWFFIKPGNITATGGIAAGDLGEISLMLIFAFVGAETALNVGGEIKKPKQTIPAGILISVLVVVILYILIQFTVMGVLGASISDYKTAPVAETARRMAGMAGVTLVIAGSIFSMFGNISGMVLNMPRILYAAARDRVMPPWSLAKIHPVFKTPYLSIIVYAMLGFIFASIGEFKQLVLLSSASYLLIYLGVVLSVIKFRITGYSEEGYRIPGGFVIPVLASVLVVWLLTNLPFNEIKAMGIFLLILVTIFPIINIMSNRK